MSQLKWVKLALSLQELQFPSNDLLVADAGGKKITLGRYKGQIFAFAHKCPHAGGILADGHIDALCNVVCPLHRYKFNMSNGRNTTGEGYFLKAYPIDIKDDGVYVGLKEGGIFGLF